MSIVKYNRSSMQSSPSGTILYPGSDVVHRLFVSIVVRVGLIYNSWYNLQVILNHNKGFESVLIIENDQC